jgi:hypothetical protein
LTQHHGVTVGVPCRDEGGAGFVPRGERRGRLPRREQQLTFRPSDTRAEALDVRVLARTVSEAPSGDTKELSRRGNGPEGLGQARRGHERPHPDVAFPRAEPDRAQEKVVVRQRVPS